MELIFHLRGTHVHRLGMFTCPHRESPKGSSSLHPASGACSALRSGIHGDVPNPDSTRLEPTRAFSCVVIFGVIWMARNWVEPPGNED